MQAIVTKYIPPTNRRGSRIKAQCERGSLILSWPDELSGDACHIWAADRLVEKFIREDTKSSRINFKYGATPKSGWGAPRACGTTHTGMTVHVFIPS